jgi:hypothetical protein
LPDFIGLTGSEDIDVFEVKPRGILAPLAAGLAQIDLSVSAVFEKSVEERLEAESGKFGLLQIQRPAAGAFGDISDVPCPFHRATDGAAETAGDVRWQIRTKWNPADLE